MNKFYLYFIVCLISLLLYCNYLEKNKNTKQTGGMFNFMFSWFILYH